MDWNIPNSTTPGDKVTRWKNFATDLEVELQPRNRKTAKSKESIVTEESAAPKDTDHLAVSSPSIRKRRGRQLTSAAEILPAPKRRKQGAGVSAVAEVSSLPKQKQGVTATAKVKSPVHSKRQQSHTARVSVEESSPRKRQGDTGDTATSAPLTSRRLQGATVVTEVQLPGTKETRGKLTPRFAVPADKDSLSPPGRRRQQGTKPLEPSSPVPARKLQGMKLSGEFHLVGLGAVWGYVDALLYTLPCCGMSKSFVLHVTGKFVSPVLMYCYDMITYIVGSKSFRSDQLFNTLAPDSCEPCPPPRGPAF